jgi:predicted AAA+ superfamily ATPase
MSYSFLMPYIPRVVDAQLDENLAAMGGVLIQGARACGKTETGLNKAASSIRFDRTPELIQIAELNPDLLLEGATPRLVDEWQLAPSIWNTIRYEIDVRKAPGQFIISGSASPQQDKTRHSGAGRIAQIRMRTMSLAESGHSSNDISLQDLASGVDEVTGHGLLTYIDMAAVAVQGGWPSQVGASQNTARRFNRTYLENLTATDIPQAAGVVHHPQRLHRLLGCLARNVATEASLANLARDMAEGESQPNPVTVREYLDALATVFVYEPLPAWSVNLRSRSRLRTNSRIHLVDPGLALAALGIGADRLAHDPEYFGQIFESLAIRDLRIYAGLYDGLVYHYRDNTGLEIDAIIEYPDWSWGAIEIKLGSSEIPKAERNLLRLRDERVDISKVGSPRFLAVITGTEFAYTLPSGVHVVPLAALRA